MLWTLKCLIIYIYNINLFNVGVLTERHPFLTLLKPVKYAYYMRFTYFFINRNFNAFRHYLLVPKQTQTPLKFVKQLIIILCLKVQQSN